MRLSNIAGLLLTLAVCSPANTQPLSSVKIAADIYEGCMTGSLYSFNINEVKAQEEVRTFLHETDLKCVDWMVIWYKPIAGEDRPDISSWTQAETTLLFARRKFLLVHYEREIMMGLRK